MAIIYDSPTTFRIDRSQVIGEQVKQSGVSKFISRTYGYLDPVTDGFYTGEDFGNEIGTQIPVVYGEALLKGQVLDDGSIRDDLDPTNIKKVVRFAMGESGAKGIKEGIPGVPESKLENVIINCKPAQDADTKEAKIHGLNLKEQAVPLALGAGAILLPSLLKLGKKDPLTGKDIESVYANALDAKKLLGSSALTGQVLAVGEDGKVAARSLADLLRETVEFEAEGGKGGKGGTGGAGGEGGTCCDCDDGTTPPPDPDPTPEPEPVECVQRAQKLISSSTITPPPEVERAPWKLLKHQGETGRYYAETVNMRGKGTLHVLLHLDGLYLEEKETWEIRDGMSNAVADSGTATCKKSGTVKIRWCIADTVDGEILDEGTKTITDATEYSLRRAISVDLQTALQEKFNKQYACDETTTVSNMDHSVQVRLYRIDTPTSSTDVYFRGFGYTEATFQNRVPKVEQAEPVQPPEDCPPLLTKAADDDVKPYLDPAGDYGTEKCPEETPGGGGGGEPGECDPAGQPGEPGSEGAEGTTGTITIKDKLNNGGTDPNDTEAPTLTIDGSRDVIYDSTATIVDFPKFTASHGANAVANATTLTVTIEIVQGYGSVSASATSSPATFTWDAGAKKATISGPKENVNAILQGPLKYVPAGDDAAWDILYKASVKDDANGKTGGVAGTLSLLNSKVERDAASAEQTIRLAGTTGNVTIKVNGIAISNSVAFNGTIEQTAQDVAASINSTKTTPDYTASYVSGSSLKLIAPSALGGDANGDLITADTTGDIKIVDGSGNEIVPAMDGGVTKTKPTRSLSSKIWGGVKAILPLAGAGLIANALYKSIAQMEIEIPEELIDENGNIAVVYQGMMVRVPNNYTVGADGKGGTYAGSWDYATFAAEPVYTTNPAWCLLDFIESKRYGCGNNIKLTDAQRTRLYQDIYWAAKRSDEMVSDFRGGTEPRYTLNTVLANLKRREALDSLASTMHAQVIFGVDGIRVMQDRPDVPIHVFTQANVFNGRMAYSGSTLDAAYNYVEVSWNNPERYWRRDTTYTANMVDVGRNGERKNTVVAFGCTSEGQAKRHGAWILTNEKSNPQVVSFSASWEACELLPGQLFVMADENMERHKPVKMIGGRVLSGSGGTYTVDRAGGISGSTVWWIDANGELQSSEATFSGTTMSVTGDIPKMSVFVTTPDAEATNHLWKILSVTELSDGEFRITAVKHDRTKYEGIDDFAAL